MTNGNGIAGSAADAPVRPAGADDLFLGGSAPRDQVLPALRSLWETLRDGEYARTATLPLPGKLRHLPIDLAVAPRFVLGQQNLMHRSAMASLYRGLLSTASRRAVELHRFFRLCKPLEERDLERLVPRDLMLQLQDIGLIRQEAARFRSRVMISPFRGRFYITDRLDQKQHADFAYTGRSSFDVGDLLRQLETAGHPSAPSGRALDMGCGAGILGIDLAEGFEELVGVDIVTRCLELAELNAALNQVTNCAFSYSDLYTGVKGEFDLILCNSPCGWSDASGHEQRTYGSGGGDYGTELPGRILHGAMEHVTDDGTIAVTLQCPIIGKKPYILEFSEELTRGRDFAVEAVPCFQEYNSAHAASYREHGITATVRYLLLLRRADRPSFRIRDVQKLVLAAYKLRSFVPYLVHGR